MNRILTVATLFSLGITTCALAETVTNAASPNTVLDMATVDVMPGLTFEKLVGSLLKRQGYEVGNLRDSSDYCSPSRYAPRFAIALRRASRDRDGGMRSIHDLLPLFLRMLSPLSSMRCEPWISRVCHSSIADQFMPAGGRELAGDQSRSCAMAIIQDFQ